MIGRLAGPARVVVAGTVTVRLARAAHCTPPISPVAARTGQTPSISVVVPARNEPGRIGPLLERLSRSAVAEVIVVDDESDDGTAAVAEAAGTKVVAGRPAPVGWVGKPWALQQGLDAATSDWVVFLDADTRPHPSLPPALVARAATDGIDVLTVAGRFECPTGPSRWLHAAMLTTLVYRFGRPGGHARRPDRLLANGQCMVVRRTHLIAAGGFAPVAGSLVEDVALARHRARRGDTVAFLDASALLTVRMYESFAATWSGWGRSISLPGLDGPLRRLFEVTILALAPPVPVIRLVTGRADRIDGVLIAARIGTLVGTRRAYGDAGAAYWLSPLADGPAVLATVRATVRRRQRWRGRSYRV